MARTTPIGGAVEGANEFATRLRRMDRGISNELGRANYRIGREVVMASRAAAEAFSPQAAKAAKSARARNSRNSVTVAIGNSRYPFAAGAEFGAIQYKQFPRWSGNQWSGWPEGVGYWFLPTITKMRPQVLDEYLVAVRDAATKAGVPMGNVHGLSAFETAVYTLR